MVFFLVRILNSPQKFDPNFTQNLGRQILGNTSSGLKGGCFDQGLFQKFRLVVSGFFFAGVVSRNAGMYCMKKGVVFEFSPRGFRGSRGFECENEQPLS